MIVESRRDYHESDMRELLRYEEVKRMSRNRQALIWKSHSVKREVIKTLFSSDCWAEMLAIRYNKVTATEDRLSPKNDLMEHVWKWKM